jgi:hypothetical protein
VRISLDLGGVFYPNAPDEDNALALQALLEALVAINRVYIRRYKRGVPKLYNAGVRYGRTQVWDSIPDLITRRYGDCKSLSAMLVAERREEGKLAKPVFRFMNNPRNGQKDFHIIVQTGAGFEDPSRILGMEEYHRRRNEWIFPQ